MLIWLNAQNGKNKSKGESVNYECLNTNSVEERIILLIIIFIEIG